VGNWLNGYMHGQGIMTCADGDVYDGDWLNDEMHGEGVMTYANGNVYKGEWQNNAKNGQGIMRYANLAVYEGEWQNNAKNGKGTMRYNDGDMYKGEWLNNAKNGQGTYTDANRHVYHGYWYNDEITGISVRTRASGILTTPYEILPGQMIENLVTLQTNRSPAALITLSDGVTHNIQTARALNERIQIQKQHEQPPTNFFNSPLTEEDVSRLNHFLTLLEGGKKRRNTQKR